MSSQKISSRDRAFFARVSRAALCNPFSEERARLDAAIARLPAAAPEGERIAAAAARVRGRIRRLEPLGLADLRAYAGEERTRMQSVFLFEVYHRYSAPFDALIADQLAAGERPVSVPFAGEAMAALVGRGFPEAEAAHHFSILFQLKRAYYFIEQGLIGQSASMKQLRRRLWSNVFTDDLRLYGLYLWNRMEDFSTLLLGETGTGKGAAAAAIGRSGYIPFDPAKKAFAESFTATLIGVNLAFYPEALIESELFGHRKGAFTGAIENHPGVFALCRPHGSIFLDEIGDVSPTVQVKLLRVLQERTFSPVGSHARERFSGRVIAATNRPLDALRAQGLFRDDFYYRLCSDTITVPPLRERLREEPGELDLILAHIVARLIGAPAPELVDLAREAIAGQVGLDYAWPGNVRELEQAVRRILLRGEYRGERPPPEAPGRGDPSAAALAADRVLARHCRALFRRHGSYEAVARLVRLDRRTVKRYVQLAAAEAPRGSETREGP
jgi:DNA-binding NtrC family response regulator